MLRNFTVTTINPSHIDHFFAAGINYKKSDAVVRSRFSVGPDQYAQLLETAKAEGIREVFVLSTCNRTEIYGYCRDAAQLENLLCSVTEGDIAEFRSISYQHRGKDAVNHLFRVAAGLDSQILGDYEIVGQLKQAVKYAKEQGTIGPFIERLFNQVLQSSKLVKNTTKLSGGTVSVAFAAIQYLKEKVADVAEKKVLLIGTGKIGRNTCKNVFDYLGCTEVTLMNRTFAKAAELATELGARAVDMEQLDAETKAADIIIVSTNSTSPILFPEQINEGKKQWVIDLSIPNNVHHDVAKVAQTELVNVDELSRMKDETLAMRQAEVPKAQAIIDQQMAEFIEWLDLRKQFAVLKTVKRRLQEISSQEHFQLSFRNTVETDRIQQVLNNMAVKMRQRNERGCQYLEAINDFMTFGSN
ncbi:glutamyl-tRNA reductase [Flavihumibacter rivuli]|uniref:glutamyl-tRNA reductase n=1 Tax=Flavihumibacter rivuli TaxID=2838156 RepID=UPI001EFA7739|nr:glutamyl-tRNA reductase [Flavihumibacter rivuli]ULQ55051.1 glutamyl-tRNA reductase [Flavihumibacter rivuli]